MPLESIDPKGIRAVGIFTALKGERRPPEGYANFSSQLQLLFRHLVAGQMDLLQPGNQHAADRAQSRGHSERSDDNSHLVVAGLRTTHENGPAGPSATRLRRTTVPYNVVDLSIHVCCHLC